LPGLLQLLGRPPLAIPAHAIHAVAAYRTGRAG
jgi:hypothetical protein